MIRAILLAAGLLSGPQHVGIDLEIGREPERIEILLDDEVVAELAEAPWEAWVDLGDELAPRELVVVSRDASGAELDRATRRLNQYVPPEAQDREATPVTILLEKNGILDRPGDTADLAGVFEVDGEPAEVLEVTYPDAEIWVVRDPLSQRRLDSSAALVVGGYTHGIPIHGETLRQGREATRDLLMQSPSFLAKGVDRFPLIWETLTRLYTFEDGTEMRLVSPLGAPVSQIETPLQIFGSTTALDANFRGLLFHTYANKTLTRWRRVADAVGLAGLESTAHIRRRAVVLLTAELDLPDESLYKAAEIRRYLGHLGIPLLVWSTHLDDSLADSLWGPVRTIRPTPAVAEVPENEPGAGYLRPLSAAVRELDQTLRRQRIVWIRGRHLTGDVRLRSGARGVRLVTESGGEIGARHDS